MANRRTLYDFSLVIGARMDNRFSQVVDTAADNVNRVGERLEKSFDGACGKAIKGLSGVGAAIGGLATKTAIEMDGENRKLQAQLGATNDEMASIREASEAVFKTGMVDDISEANNIMLELTRTMEGLSDQDKITIGQRVATLDLTYDTDAAEITRTADSIMKNFGASAEEAMDYIGWGMQNNLDFSGEFLDTINEYGPQFRDAGYSAQEMFAILKSGTEGGAWNLDKVGDAAKEFGLRIKDGSKSTKEAMQSLSKETRSIYKDMLNGSASTSDVMGAIVQDLSSMEDQTEAFRLAQSLFGTMSEDLTMDTLYNLYDIGAETVEVTGTVQQMADVLQQGVGLRAKAALHEGKLAFADLGKEILTVAMPAIEGIMGAVSDASQWFIGLDDNTKKMIVTIGGVVTAVGPAILAVNGVGKALTVTAGALKGVGTAAKVLKLGVTALASPVGIAVIIFGALALGAAYVATHIDELQERFNHLKQGVGDAISGVKDSIVGGIGSAVDMAKSSLSNLGETVGGFLKAPVNAGIGLINKAIGSVNELSFDVPEWVPGLGGKHLGFDISPITPLATGGIVTRPTMALIGEGQESEAVLPLSKLQNMLNNGSGSSWPSVSITVHVEGGNNPEQTGLRIADVVKREIANYMHQQKRLSLGGVK